MNRAERRAIERKPTKPPKHGPGAGVRLDPYKPMDLADRIMMFAAADGCIDTIETTGRITEYQGASLQGVAELSELVAKRTGYSFNANRVRGFIHKMLNAAIDPEDIKEIRAELVKMKALNAKTPRREWAQGVKDMELAIDLKELTK